MHSIQVSNYGSLGIERCQAQQMPSKKGSKAQRNSLGMFDSGSL